MNDQRLMKRGYPVGILNQILCLQKNFGLQHCQPTTHLTALQTYHVLVKDLIHLLFQFLVLAFEGSESINRRFAYRFSDVAEVGLQRLA